MRLYHRDLGATERVSKGQSWNNLSNEIKKRRGREVGGGNVGVESTSPCIWVDNLANLLRNSKQPTVSQHI